MGSCPSVEVLKQLLAERLTQNEMDSVAKHVHDCAACAETLARLAADSHVADWRRLLREHEQETVAASGIMAGPDPFLPAPPPLSTSPAGPIPGYDIIGELG